MLKMVREASLSNTEGKQEEATVEPKVKATAEPKVKIKRRKRMTYFDNQTYTITFSETVENHVGMEKISIIDRRDTSGFSYDELVKAYHSFKDAGGDVDFIDLRKECGIERTEFWDDPEADAYVLVIYDGCKVLRIDPDSLYREQQKLEYDTKALMKGKVVNKHARHNLCFADYTAIADFENGKGTVVDFKDLPGLRRIRERLPWYIPRSENLFAEANKYYDAQNCYIGYHGDRERNMIVGLRLGTTFPLHYQYYYKSEPLGDRFTVDLPHGCIYMMERKASGNDWLKKNIITIRHAAGDLKNILK